MELQLLVKLAGRLRSLSEREFMALVALVERGEEREEHLDSVSKALLDCIQISDEHTMHPRMRLVPA